MSTTTTTGPSTSAPTASSAPTSATSSLISLPPLTTGPTSATTPSSSTSSTTSSSSSSGTSSSSSSSTTSSTTSTVPSTATSSHNVATTPSTTNLPAVITEVSTTFISASESSTPSAVVAKAPTNNGFFANKAAVAGVFTVVGLIGLVILIALLTNAVRRHRAKKFDKELFAATREAAATAPNPIFLDDDDDSENRLKHSGYGPGYGGAGGNGYNGSGNAYSSDGSHGQYGQPPMEAYNMRDMMGHSVPVGEIYDPYAAGGAAGIGVARARSAKANLSNVAPNVYAAALQEGGSPYPKFAIGPHDSYASGGAGAPFGRGPNTNNTEFGVSRGQPQQYPQQSPPPQEYATLGRSKSGSTAATHVSTPSLPHSPSYSQQQYPVRQMSPPQTTSTPSLPNPHAQVYQSHKVQPSGGSTPDDAYGGYVVDEADEDEVEVEAPKRVLKIANES